MSVVLSTSSVGVTRMSLTDALALGPATWETLEASTASPSPFMSWAWYRAWADASPSAEVAASEALVLRGAEGVVQAVLPVRLRRVAFHRVPVTALTWAPGDAGKSRSRVRAFSRRIAVGATDPEQPGTQCNHDAPLVRIDRRAGVRGPSPTAVGVSVSRVVR